MGAASQDGKTDGQTENALDRGLCHHRPNIDPRESTTETDGSQPEIFLS
jgi:hypothetical protein